MQELCIEVCVETLEAARAAEAGGASRVELCAGLTVGGVTPLSELLAATVKSIRIPVRVIIRPRGGDFVYSAEEFERMLQQVDEAKTAGAAGVVVGVLRADGSVDVERSRALVERARPLGATFHRAFDETRNLDEALEAVLATGAEYLLTSGGQADVLAGAEAIARLHRGAGDRMAVMAGGGLRLTNLSEVVRRTGVTHLHGSFRRYQAAKEVAVDALALEADVREAVRLFRLVWQAREATAG